MTDALLKTALATAVPLWVDRLQRQPWRYVEERARICGQHVAEKGDVIMYRGRRGETAEAFNRLAEGIAALSFAPGGVRFLDMHFQHRHTGD